MDTLERGGVTADDLSAQPEKLVFMSNTDRFTLPAEVVHEFQLKALRRRFAEGKEAIPVLGKLAKEQGISQINRLEDAAPLLLRNSAYKSYPLSFIDKGQYANLTKWLNNLTSHDLSKVDVSDCKSLDNWVDAIAAQTPIRITHSSGTSGRLSFLPRSEPEVRLTVENYCHMAEGFGDEPDVGANSKVPDMPLIWPGYRKGATESARLHDGFVKYVYDGDEAMIVYMSPDRVSADALSIGGRLQAAEAKGEQGRLNISPEIMALVEKARREAITGPEQLRGYVKGLEKYRGKPVYMFTWTWMLFQMAQAGEELGMSNLFSPDSIVVCGGGNKGRVLPDDHMERIYRFLGVDRIWRGYGMSECICHTRACPEGKYHLQPWTIPYLLDPYTGEQFPRTGTQKGHLGLLDLQPETYWGGFLTGDEVTLHWGDTNPCACGRIGPYLDDDVRRYSESEGGDDKITCAGVTEAHDKALQFLNPGS